MSSRVDSDSASGSNVVQFRPDPADLSEADGCVSETSAGRVLFALGPGASDKGDMAMLTETEKRCGTFKGSGWRSQRRGRWAGAAAGLVAVAAAGLLAAVPAAAQVPPRDATVFVHSAKSGELGGGRLTLHGVSGRVTWAHNSGRSGVMKVKRLHRMLFSAKTTTATGTLHVAGHRGGDELTFKLSRPRYNAARRTVSYRIKRLGGGRTSQAAAPKRPEPRAVSARHRCR